MSELRLVLGFLEDADVPDALKPMLKDALIAELNSRPPADFEKIVDSMIAGATE